MHVRFSTVRGLPVVEETTEEAVAVIDGILIHPDTGVVEGFFVRTNSFLHSEILFLPVADIRHWGSRVRIAHAHVLSPLEDLFRLHRLQEEGRTILLQPIVTENGMRLGKCRDVQFDTKLFMLEYLFPRKYLRWRLAIPASSIVEVKKGAVIVRDAVTIPEVETGPSVFDTLDPLGTTTSQRVVDYEKC